MPRTRAKTPHAEPVKLDAPPVAPAAPAVPAPAAGRRARAVSGGPKAAAPARPAELAKPAKLAKPEKPPKAEKPAKPRKALVRDSFTMPEADFALIAALKERAVGAGRPAKKSELLRAGLRALAALEAKKLRSALEGLEPIKVGRPRQD